MAITNDTGIPHTQKWKIGKKYITVRASTKSRLSIGAQVRVLRQEQTDFNGRRSLNVENEILG